MRRIDLGASLLSERETGAGARLQLKVRLDVVFSAEHPRLEGGDEGVLADLG